LANREECHTASTFLDALTFLAQSGTLWHEVALQNIDLCELVVMAVDALRILLRQRNILDWSLPPENVVYSSVDSYYKRLLGILLDNAIRYTPEGGQVTAELPGSEEVTVDSAGYG